MKKSLIIILIILILLTSLSLGFIYLKNVFVPKTLKILIEDFVKNNTNLKIQFGAINYNLGKGVTINNIALFEQNKTSQDKIINIQQVSFNVLPLPSLKGKQIIIPAIYITQPVINIERLNDKTWNLEHFLKGKQSTAKPGPNVLILKIKVSGAKISIKDKIISPVFSRELTNLNFEARPANLKNIGFKLSSDIRDDKSNKGKIKTLGAYNLSGKILKAKCELENIELSEILNYLPIPDTKINKLSLQDLKTDFTYSLSSQNLLLSAQAQINNFDLKIKDLSGAGELKLNIKSSIKSLSTKPLISFLSANLDFSGTKLSGLDKVGALDDIETKISIKDNLMRVNEFKCRWDEDILTLTANIPLGVREKAMTKKPASNIDVACESLNLNKLTAILPKSTLSFIENVSGRARLKAHLEFYPDELDKFKFAANLNLKNSYLKLTNFKNEITNISGNISLSNDDLKWTALNFSLSPYGIVSTGTLNNFATPSINLDLSSQQFKLKTQISLNLNAEKGKIHALNITASNSWLNANGDIHFKKQEPLSADLNLEAKLETSDISSWLPQAKQPLEQLTPKGMINLKANVSGPITNLYDCNITLSAESPALKLANLNLSNLKINYGQVNEMAEKFLATADFYAGTFSLNASGSIAEKNRNIDLKVQVHNIALAQLKSDIGLKDQDLAGTINAQANLNIKEPIIDSITGDGSIEIKDGKIWQMRPFQGLGEFLVIPDFSHINFKEGQATFTIANKRIYTQDLILNNPNMNLMATGSLGFDGGLDFEASCKFSEEYLQHSADLRKLITSFFTQMQEYVTLKISGNVKKPQYQVIPAKINVNILQPLKDMFQLP